VSVGFRVGKATVTAELLSRTKCAVFAAAVQIGELSHPSPQKRLLRNVERVWRHWHKEKTIADGAVQAAEV